MDEKKLELTLGLPGDGINWGGIKKSIVRERDESLLSLGYYNKSNGGVIGCGKEHGKNPWVSSCCTQKTQGTTSGNEKGVSASNNNTFSPSSTAVPKTNTTSQKRAAPAPVVGWPPIRSFRKNLASTSSGKPGSEPQSANPSKPSNETPASIKANGNKGQFVKINMDGVPIGRKVDLCAYNNYDSLSSAVDELFRGLLAAQRDSSAGEKDNKQEEQKPITGLLDGSGEYTLVYEDNEGDRMLVGDVPWHMFVSTVKRLRVLKSSDLPTLNRGGSKEGKILDCSSK